MKRLFVSCFVVCLHSFVVVNTSKAIPHGFEIPCRDYFNGYIMFRTGLLIFLNLLVFSDFTAVNNAAMDIFELYIHCVHFQSGCHCPEQEKRRPEHGCRGYITAELTGPEKRCQV